jgi:hypothetical protein
MKWASRYLLSNVWRNKTRGKGNMSECDRLIGIVQSLIGVLDATRSKPMLHQLVSMALVVASEDLVKRGFEPARLCELGVIDEVAYLLDAACRPAPSGPDTVGTPTRARGVPHLRLVGS